MLQTDLLDRIAATTKKNEKLALLKQVEGETRELLRLALDPMVTFGLTVAECTKHGWSGDPQEVQHELLQEAEWWPVLTDLASRLASRSLTGNEAKEAVHVVCQSAPNAAAALWASRMLNKDLRAGVAGGIVLDAIPDLYEEFEVWLAKPYEDQELPETAVLERKLDGLRMVVMGGKAFTRNGHVISSVDPIIEQLPDQVRNKFVTDGEIVGAEFDDTSGQVRQKKGRASESLVYNVFDLISLQEWKSRDTAILLERKEMMTELLIPYQTENIGVVPWDIVKNITIEVAIAKRDNYLSLGYEGVMIKDASSQYVWGRNNSMMKLKKMDNLDGIVVGTYEGKKGKTKGKLGGLSVRHSGKIKGGLEVEAVTDVGSGFTDKQRVELWAMREQLVGWCVEIQFQNFTSKEGRMRFPVYLGRRPDKE
jgi:hypothetical protein